MAKKSLSIDFPLYDQLKKRLEAFGEDKAEKAAENALKKSQDYVQGQLRSAMIPHEKTGDTVQTLNEIDAKNPVWVGTEVSIPVGFDIAGGGLASIFLMYGTQVHGQPHVAPDRKLYDALYGTQTKNQIKKIQEAEFRKALEEAMKE